ncbi:MAG: hypothetical protein R3185_02520 [Candidatus Thermoplasmatota archaeon]|nr:hypothetical protein [Candidatus Thermoplasmatota archaeon]
MADIDQLLGSPGKVTDVLGGEELILEAFREMVKDELKRHIRESLDDNPELKQEVRDAVGRYFEAKVMQTLALLALGKAGAKVSLEALPEHLRGKVGQDLAKAIEQDLTAVLEKTL